MENQEYEPIPAPVTWFGSKSRLVKQITSHFPEHKTFVDVFGGSGVVLLGRRPSKVEVYNDINSKMAALYHVLSCPQKTAELQRRLNFTPYSRSEFDACKHGVDSIDDEIEIARQMIVIQRQSHGGLGKQWSYCVDAPAAGYSASVRKFHAGIERLSEVSRRIRKVQVDNLPWESVLTRYDREQTLFYLDPPYIPETRVNGNYEHEMSPQDHERLVDHLLKIKGLAVLSGYQHPIYSPLENAGWQRVEIDTIASTSKNRSKRIETLWISPNCKKPVAKGVMPPTDEPSDLSRQQQAAYRTHEVRVSQSEQKITEAIRTLKRLKKRVSKAEVSRMTGINRVQISRRYAHLF
ncbi:DNA adenine methylase [Marinobacterium jannaschii]|uniref:DNA adenine methylase n=1 Tax=Marinobacterium jannaschii TaxID=64970 RepID=UPI0004876A27|nr:DNA adenine methylase [Marinobacterium jannaschii]